MHNLSRSYQAEKQCTKCKEVKSPTDFYKNRNKKDGLNDWCKSCLKPLIAQHKKLLSTRLKELERARRPEVRERDNENRKNRRLSNPEKYRIEYAKERDKQDPIKLKARMEVKKAVSKKILPRVTTLTCSDCRDRQAKHYHHYKGYEPEHWLDVIPLCTFCHAKEWIKYART